MRSETSFELDGDLIVVAAMAIGPSGKAEVRLVLDTGAVLTALIPAIADGAIQPRFARACPGSMLTHSASCVPSRRAAENARAGEGAVASM